MGKPTADQPPPTISNSTTHFSHPHPLHLLNPQTLPQTPPCSACMLDASPAAIYACINCNFVLHQKCSQLPQQISHPFDEKHALTLYPKPVYPEGLFNCDACGHRGAGFSYHCSPCGIDLHSTCASLPLKYTHTSHHHPLSLTFSAPYTGNSFSCDICKKLGAKTWIYRCAACEFDVHVTCVASLVPPRTPIHQLPHVVGIARSFVPQNRPTNVGTYGPPQAAGQYGQNPYPVGMAQAYGGAGQPAYGGVGQPAYGGARPVNGLRDQVVIAVAEGVAGGIAQSATQAIFQEVFGVGGGGGGVVGMDGGGATAIDGGSYNYDGGYGAADGGYSCEDGTY